MINGRYGGTAGRSRTVRDRNRAERLYGQYLISEYLSRAVQAERLIPIGRRSDFCPTVSASVLGSGVEFGRQLELPLTASIGDDRPANGRSHQPTLGGPAVAEPFSLRRFFFGCAIGGSAAAAVLLALVLLT